MSEAQLQTLWANGAKAWADVPNASQWVEEVRGNVEDKRMSDTPRTDAACYDTRGHEVTTDFARQLERKLNAANERIKLLERALSKQSEEICQTAGKALGYPWFKDDQKNFTGATEADGVCVGEHVAETIVAEFAKKHAEANERIKRLEHAGPNAIHEASNDRVYDAWEIWNKASE